MDMAEFMIGAGVSQSETVESVARVRKSICGCGVDQLTRLLRIAVGNGRWDFSIVVAGADVNLRGLGDEWLLLLCVKSGSFEILLDLIASGAEIDGLKDLVLHEVAKMKSVELMEVLVKGFPNLDPNLVDLNGQNALHVLVSLGDIEGMRFLISVEGDGDGFVSASLGRCWGSPRIRGCIRFGMGGRGQHLRGGWRVLRCWLGMFV